MTDDERVSLFVVTALNDILTVAKDQGVSEIDVQFTIVINCLMSANARGDNHFIKHVKDYLDEIELDPNRN